MRLSFPRVEVISCWMGYLMVSAAEWKVMANNGA